MNDESRDTLREIADGLVKELSAKEKIALDLRVNLAVLAMKKSFPDVDDDILSEFAHSLAYIMASFSVMPVNELSSSLQTMFTAYSVTAAALAGVYDTGLAPKDEDIPSELREEKVAPTSPASHIGMYL